MCIRDSSHPVQGFSRYARRANCRLRRSMAYRASAHSRRHWFRIARAGALLALLVSVAVDVEARGGRGGGGGFRGGGFGGGGIRGGGSTSIGRGGDFGRGSYDRG